MAREGWRQLELRADGWIRNHEPGMKQRWRHEKCPIAGSKEWLTVGEAIKINRQWLKLEHELIKQA